MKTLILAIALYSAQTLMAQDIAEPTLAPTEYKQLAKKEKGVLVDVRTPEEFKNGHLKKARNSDLRGGKFNNEYDGWDRSKTYYLYCASGNRSGQALKLMQEAGFANVYNLGAYKDLKAAGLKTTEGQRKK